MELTAIVAGLLLAAGGVVVLVGEVLSDTELVRDLRESLADARAGRVFSAEDVAADPAARRAAGQ
jgi:hypothetical protein